MTVPALFAPGPAAGAGFTVTSLPVRRAEAVAEAQRVTKSSEFESLPSES